MVPRELAGQNTKYKELLIGTMNLAKTNMPFLFLRAST